MVRRCQWCKVKIKYGKYCERCYQPETTPTNKEYFWNGKPKMIFQGCSK